MSLTLKSIKGSELTEAEADANFQYLDSLLIPTPTLNSPNGKVWWVTDGDNDDKTFSCSDTTATVLTTETLPNVKLIAYHPQKLCSRIATPEVDYFTESTVSATKDLTLGYQTVTFDSSDFPNDMYYAKDFSTIQPFSSLTMRYIYIDSVVYLLDSLAGVTEISPCLLGTEYYDRILVASLSSKAYNFGATNLWRFDSNFMDSGSQVNNIIASGPYDVSQGYLSGNGSTVSMLSNLPIPFTGNQILSISFRCRMPSSAANGTGINFIIGETPQDYNVEIELTKVDDTVFKVTVYSHNRATTAVIASNLLLDSWWTIFIQIYSESSSFSYRYYNEANVLISNSSFTGTAPAWNDTKKYQIAPVGGSAQGHLDAIMLTATDVFYTDTHFKAYLAGLYDAKPYFTRFIDMDAVIKDLVTVSNMSVSTVSKTTIDTIDYLVVAYDTTRYIYGLFSMAITGLIDSIKLQFTRTTRV